DYIIIGSGAGGAAAAFKLVQSGRTVLLLEKGRELPMDGSTLDVGQVIREGRFKSHETWLDGDLRKFAPEEYFNVGGKTKWYGAALLRYSPHEFEADPAHQCLAWPIGYRDLEAYYDEAERRLGVHSFPGEANLTSIARRITRHDSGWRSEPLPLALSPEIIKYREEAIHFDAFASVKGLKADAERVFIDPVRSSANFRLHSGDAVAHLIPDESDSRRVEAVVTESGQRFEGRTLLLAAGALHSPRLLQDYLAATGLDKHLPSAAAVGRNYKQHLLTAMLGFTPSRQTDLLRKTLILLHEKLPHSSVQPLGFDAELIGGLMPKLLPHRLATMLGQYAYGFFLQTEDGSHDANRVIAGGKGLPPQLDYDPRRLAPARHEHRRLVRAFRRAMLSAKLLGFSRTIPLSGTAHACGSLAMGNDPTTSVVDALGRVHGMHNLHVVDGSVLPRSGRVNPSLTIFAWALRIGENLARKSEEQQNETNSRHITA
ncbi:MAG: FAD-dependent oxidoreductase, partial [Burkholderiales bacterium]